MAAFSPRPFSPRQRLIALAVCLFALVVGCRWGVSGRYGTQLPEEDGWDAEGINVFVPRAHHDLHWADFWKIHVDHHVALTRLLAYVETVCNERWDQRLETVVNAVLAAVIAAGLFLYAAPRLDRRWQCIWFLLLAVCFAVPWARDNFLRGFHSQQYFLVGLALLVLARPASWIGWIAAILSLGAMASGFFAAALAAALLLWRRRSIFPSVLIYAAVIVAACAAQTSMPATEMLKARSASEFVTTLVQSVGWPGFGSHWEWAGLLLYLPWLLVVVRVARRGRAAADPWSDFIVLLGAWSLAQSVAAAYARGWGGLPPPSRYIDNILVGLLANALALSLLLEKIKERPHWRPTVRTLAAVWFVILFTGFASTWPDVLAHLWATGRSHAAMEANVRGYLATHDPRFLEHGDIPYTSVEGTRVRLNIPELRPLLAGSFQVPPEPDPFGSRAALALTRAGFFLAAAALLAALILLI